MMMRNVAKAIAAGALALALAACGAEEVMEDVAVSQTAEGEGATERQNPWQEVDNAEAAAEVAGFDHFSPGAGTITRLGSDYIENFVTSLGHCSDEIYYESMKVDLASHKGQRDAYEFPEEYDSIFFDSSDYSLTWTQTIGDVEVTCMGNREGESMKTSWSKDGYDYVIYAIDLTFEDEAFGLTADELQEMVPAVN